MSGIIIINSGDPRTVTWGTQNKAGLFLLKTPGIVLECELLLKNGKDRIIFNDVGINHG